MGLFGSKRGKKKAAPVPLTAEPPPGTLTAVSVAKLRAAFAARPSIYVHKPDIEPLLELAGLFAAFATSSDEDLVKVARRMVGDAVAKTTPKS